LVKSSVTPNQFAALTSFAYNAGIGNLKSSTLLKKVNANHNDPSIALEFAKWDKAGGKVLAGLTKRRASESKLYFTP
jgi:lysozyme